MFLKKITFLFFVICISSNAQVNFGSIQIIDDSETANGISHIAKVDLNNDGFIDLLVTEAYNSDAVVIYWNDGNANFTAEVLDEAINDPVYVTTADITGNGFQDVLVITESDGELKWYANSQGTFANPILIDTDETFGKGIVTGYFDEDDRIDFVAIWQHAIKFYHNGGAGNFTPTPILTTENSPNILECWTITKGDINNDGNLDVITGETIGSVVYENDGHGNFTPHTITQENHTTITALAGVDVNQDTFIDFVMQGSSGNVSLYLNEGNTSMNYIFDAEIFQGTVNTIKQFEGIDIDGDNHEDLYTAFEGTPFIYLSGSDMSFSENLPLVEDESLFINRVLVADIDNDEQNELIWSAPSGVLAYQENETLGINEVSIPEISVYPNPSKGNLKISAQETMDYILFDGLGKKIKSDRIQASTSIDLENLSNGIYYLKLIDKSGKNHFQKIVLEK